MPITIFDDVWAMKAIEYLVRKDYSTQEILNAMVEVGIRNVAIPTTEDQRNVN